MDGSSGASVECPPDAQRSVGALLLKYLLFSCTSLGFYSLFHRQREGKYFSWDTIIFVFAPLNIIFRYLFALIVILGFSACQELSARFAPDPDQYEEQTSSQVKTALLILFGRNPDAITSADSLIDPLSEALEENRKYVPLRVSRGGRRAALIFTSAFVANCLGAIYLYSRRYQHDSDATTSLDDQIFHLACGGLFLALLSTTYTLNLPLFKNPMPTPTETPLDQIIFHLRDHGTKYPFLFYLAYSCIVSFIGQTILGPLRFIFHESTREFWLFGFGTCALFAICFSIATGISSTNGRRNFSFVDRLCRGTAFTCAYLGMVIAVILAAGAVVVAFFWHIGLFWGGFSEILGLLRPERVEDCKMLWRDPGAWYFWWLA